MYVSSDFWGRVVDGLFVSDSVSESMVKLHSLAYIGHGGCHDYVLDGWYQCNYPCICCIYSRLL